MIKFFSKLFNRIRLLGKLRHLARIRKAKKIMKKMRTIVQFENGGGRVVAYLRKINPYVFEELVLSSIEERNILIVRNVRYSGDGGIDGRFSSAGGKVLVQCKRYSGYIDRSDVVEFAKKVKEEKCYAGVFVHTGKTGDLSKKEAERFGNVAFVSGSSLVALIVGKLDVERHIDNKIVKPFKR